MIITTTNTTVIAGLSPTLAVRFNLKKTNAIKDSNAIKKYIGVCYNVQRTRRFNYLC